MKEFKKENKHSKNINKLHCLHILRESKKIEINNLNKDKLTLKKCS